MSVILNLVPEKDMIAFSGNYNPTTSSLLDQLFPNEKTSNLVATYQTVKKDQFAEMAEVHAFNTEAKIATRAPFSEKEIKKFLIKEKINQGEEMRKKIKDLGMDASDNAIILAIYEDIANQISKVLVGFERRACELISTGKIEIDEKRKYAIEMGSSEEKLKELDPVRF